MQGYARSGEERLDAGKRVWGWREAAQRAFFDLMRGMQCVFIMLGAILVESLRGEGDLARARTAQCMRAIRQHVLDLTWMTLWLLTFLEDPLSDGMPGGTEPEMEAPLAYPRTRGDLRRGAGQFDEASEQVSDGGGQAEGKRGRQWNGEVPKEKVKEEGTRRRNRGADAAQADS